MISSFSSTIYKESHMFNIVQEARSRMQKAFDILLSDFATVRTGKASPTLVENININAYGGSTRLKVLELASIHVQLPSTLVITPFDKTIISDIQKGISDANVGLNPIVDGDILRINLPPLTEERRKEFVKLIHQKAENARVMIRQIRHEAMENIKKKGSENISEDEIIRLEKNIQKATDEYMQKLDVLKDEKETELMRL